jgi:hypothetical protein
VLARIWTYGQRFFSGFFLVAVFLNFQKQDTHTKKKLIFLLKATRYKGMAEAKQKKPTTKQRPQQPTNKGIPSGSSDQFFFSN